MIDSILSWILEKILAFLLGKAVSAAEDKFQEIQTDKERGEVNDANTKAYEAAVDRKDRIDAALGLLNRERR